MISKGNPKFWKLYKALPLEIKKKSKRAYKLFKKNPWYPSLHFKRVHSTLPIYSARINKNYRVLGILENEKIIWFWIGSHSEYDYLIKSIK